MLGSMVVDDLLKHFAVIDNGQVEISNLNMVKLPLEFFQ